MQKEKNQLLQEITNLSHEFGTADYVCGGGGNTSVKNDTTLWVKPSGTTLGGLKPELFVALDRGRLAELYDITPPQEASAREALIKEKMSAALLPDQTSRPSVEAPLHDSLSARFIVHTHPALVNGMTCAKEGAVACGRLFPEALWLDYVDPGYSLCIAVRERIRRFVAEEGREPSLIFLKNHGVFVAGGSPQEIRDLYASICNRLLTEYANANIPIKLNIPPLPENFDLNARRQAIRRAFADDDTHRPIELEFHHLHRSLHRSPAVLVPAVDDRSEADRRLGIQPQLDIRIPARVIANVLHREEMKHLVYRPVDHLAGFHCHSHRLLLLGRRLAAPADCYRMKPPR